MLSPLWDFSIKVSNIGENAKQKSFSSHIFHLIRHLLFSHTVGGISINHEIGFFFSISGTLWFLVPATRGTLHRDFPDHFSFLSFDAFGAKMKREKIGKNSIFIFRWIFQQKWNRRKEKFMSPERTRLVAK